MEPKKNLSKDVHRYSKHFFLIGLCISTLLVIVAFEWRIQKKITLTKHPTNEDVQFSAYPIPITYQENKPTTKPQLIKPIQVNPLIITEVKNIVNEISENIEPDIDFRALSTIEMPIDIPIDTFIFVENMPMPEGGYEAFYTLMKENIKYPIKAKNRNAEGKVFVEFIVNTDGVPVNMKVLKSVGYGCDEEAMRVLRLAKWNPGKQRGRSVPVKMVMPVFFKLN